MIAWPIQAAIDSNLFDHIVVSTDDEEIANVAKDYGADTPFFRPLELSDDFTTTRPVIRHAVESLEGITGQVVEQVCCIYATAAFVTSEDLIKGQLAVEENENLLFSFAGVAYPYPIQRALKINDNGNIEMISPETKNTRTQDLETCYHDVGMFYWGKRNGFFSDIPMFSKKSKIIEIDRQRAHDIDDPTDWAVAEMAFECLYEK